MNTKLQPGLNIYHFERDIEGNLISLNVGRLALGKGSVVRMFITPNGLTLSMPKKAKENGEILWIDDDEVSGLGMPVKK